MATIYALIAVAIAAAAVVLAVRKGNSSTTGPAAPDGRMKLTLAGALSYAAGISGTYTVPAGAYVIGLTCVSSAGGTLVITPFGSSAGPSITIPAGVSFSLAEPLIHTSAQIPAGSTLAFGGTTSYVVVLGP